MPNRIIKESICTSPNVDRLSRDAEVFFYRLLVQCDDFGRMDARRAILRARCYPLQIDRVTEAQIGAWLAELEAAGLVTIYHVESGEYLHIQTWEKHQQVRAKRSKYPAPPTHDSNGYPLLSDDSICPRNPIQSESESKRDEGLARPPASPPPPSQEPTDQEYGAALSKLESLGMMTGPALLEFQSLWPDLDNGRRAWIDDAITVAHANSANSPVYAIRVLANSVKTGKRPGSTPKQQGARPQGHNLRELLGLDKDD